MGQKQTSNSLEQTARTSLPQHIHFTLGLLAILFFGALATSQAAPIEEETREDVGALVDEDKKDAEVEDSEAVAEEDVDAEVEDKDEDKADKTEDEDKTDDENKADDEDKADDKDKADDEDKADDKDKADDEDKAD